MNCDPSIQDLFVAVSPRLGCSVVSPRSFLRILLVLAALVPSEVVVAQQRVRLSAPPATLAPAPTATSTSSSGATLVPVQTAPAGSAAPGATMGAPTFDPYSSSPNPATTVPSLGTAPPAWSGGTPTAPASPAPYSAAPPSGVAPYSGTTGTTVAPPPTAPGTGYAAPGYTQQPPVLFPSPQGFGTPTINWPQPEQGRYLRFFQEVRAQDTWLTGSDSTVEMQTHDIEMAAMVNFPNFFWSGRPLHVTPTFVLSLWDGPDDADMPSKVYAAYLDLGWEPMLTPQFGFDLDWSIGVFSDFNSVTEESLRTPGSAVAVLNLTPTITLKGGVVYLDRVAYEWLPAVGLLWQPNPRVRWDIYFPRPKLSQYLTTLGNTDVWWYLAGEIGGGSWTVERIGTGDDSRTDINDLRVGGGFEWRNPSSLRAFIELAYVFDRKLVYASGPILEQPLDDTLMVRGGFAY